MGWVSPSDQSAANRFFKYNDEQVTEVPAAEVLQDRTGSDANPALLCYVRKDRDLVETLHREVFDRLNDVDELERAGDEEGKPAQTQPRDVPKEEFAQTAQQPARPEIASASLGDVEMGGQEVQASKTEAEAQLVDIEMSDPATTATTSEKPLIDLSETTSPGHTGGVKEKEDDLMD